MNSLRVLLIEDELFLGEIMSEVLTDRGFAVRWFVRARCTNGVVVLMDADGIEVVLDGDSYDVALVDGQLKNSALNGWDLTPWLVKMKLPVIATSGDPDVNKSMIKAGASATIRKDYICASSPPDVPVPEETVRDVARRKVSDSSPLSSGVAGRQ